MAESNTSQILAQLAAHRLAGLQIEAPALQASIRQRPSMYVGGTDERGLHHTLTGLIDISAAEFLQGATTLKVTLGKELATIADNGPGISGVPIPELDGRSLLEIAATTYFLNGGLRHDGSDRCRVDIPAAAALAETFRIESCHQGRGFEFSMCRGVPAGPTRDLGPTDRQGIRFEWSPDPTIFRETKFDLWPIRERLQFLAAYHPGLVVDLEASGCHEQYSCPSGMADLVRSTVHGDPVYPQVFSVQARVPGLSLDVAFQHRKVDATTIETYANGQRTVGNGAHWRGFERGIISLLRAKARERHPGQPTAVDTRSFERGLVAVLSVDAANLEFESPTRYRIMNGEIEGQIAAAVRTRLDVWLREHPSLFETLLSRATRRD